jgi:hypothetical protein
MRKISILAFTMSICLPVFSQNTTNSKIFLFFDHAIVYKMRDSLLCENINTFIVLQKNFDTIKYKNCLPQNSYTDVVTYFGWLENNNKIKLILISDLMIYEPQYISDSILNVKDKNNLWITNDEDHTEKFAPNIGDGKEIFILITGKEEMFFEYGNHNLDYALDKRKELYRIEFLDLVGKELLQVDPHWQFNKFYNRDIELQNK